MISHYGLFDKKQVHIQYHEQLQGLICTRHLKCFVLNLLCSEKKNILEALYKIKSTLVIPDLNIYSNYFQKRF